MDERCHCFDCTKLMAFSRFGDRTGFAIWAAISSARFGAEGALTYDVGKLMTTKSLCVGAVTVGAILGIAGCGGSSTAPTPTPSSGGLTIPGIPGLGTGSSGSAPAATTLLTAAQVQSISGDPSVTALSGACTATTCVYSDTTG